MLDQQTANAPGIRANNTKVKYAISVKENTDGTRNITVAASGGGEIVTLTGKDSTPFSNRGIIRIKQNTSGNPILHYIKAYATPTNQVTGTRDVTVVDKVFKTEDTVESLTNEGFVFVTTPVNIATPEDYTKAGVTYPYGNKYNYSSSYSTDGISWNNSSSTGNTGKVYYNKTLSGDYTVTTTTKVQYQATYFYINRTDSNNYYKITTLANEVTLEKKVGGTTYPASKFEVKGSWTFGSRNNGYGRTTTIDVRHNDDGGITFTISGQTLPWQDSPMAVTITDDGVTNGAIVPSGVFRTEIPTSRGALYDLNIVEHQDVVDDGEFTGDFYNGDSYISSYEKGDIYFNFPVAAIGSYNVVAALYEDNMMTELKTFEPLDLYAGKVKLFDTKNSTAEKSSIKVYLLDTSSALNQVTQVWELK